MNQGGSISQSTSKGWSWVDNQNSPKTCSVKGFRPLESSVILFHDAESQTTFNKACIPCDSIFDLALLPQTRDAEIHNSNPTQQSTPLPQPYFSNSTLSVYTDPTNCRPSPSCRWKGFASTPPSSNKHFEIRNVEESDRLT
ncbi:hypothetical protein CEXT_107611 [Caerostris extrusa]|uniref:Uncharacterized protein n=1 Tax=Caerostris extrusa TaxID=172846 RepID=A0AAV4TMW2_CAEEX|nr:hypothetical protein CEXT_107611 [Caerostris extrusa]